MNSPSLWVWQQVEDWRWLHCRLLSEWPHAFGCRQLHPRQPPQLAAHLQLPPQRAAWGQQVHGPDWMWADEAIDALYPLLHQASPEVTGSRPQADAVIARRGSDSAWVCTADCVPILLASREWVAAIHAGWRGTAAKILPNVLQQFLQVGIPESTAPPSALIPSPPQLGTESIPMPVRTLGNSRFKLLGLNVGVAGGTAELLLDTGSAGLRILSSAVGPFGLERTTTPSTVTFGDGTQFIGVLARAPFSLGGIQSREPVTLQLIDQVTCVDALVSGCSETLFGQGKPFAGILGTALDERSTDREVFSPLTRLPGNFRSGYILQTGGFNSTQGIFTIGLTAVNTAGFNFRQFPQVGIFPDGTPIWRDEALQAAYTISNTSIQNVLSPTNFDSGSSDIFLNVRLLGAAPFSTATLPPGAEWRAVLEGAFDYRIRVGFPVTPGRDRIFVNGLLNKQLLGMPLFFSADVAFDIERGRVGFRLR